MIGVQVMRDLHEAKNMALKAKLMIQDRRRIESPRRNYGSYIYEVLIVEELNDHERQSLKDHLIE